jgi:hypothetical protein
MAARFWVGGTGTWDSTTTANWSATSGGAGGASVPGAADDVTINTASITVTTNYNVSVISVTINASAATLSLGGTLTCSGAITLTQGTFTTNNYNVTATQLSSNNGNTRTINLGSSTVTLSATSGTINFNNNAGLAFNAGTSTIACSGAGSNITTGSTGGSGSGVTFYNVSYTSTSVSTHALLSINTFNNLAVAAPASAGVTQVTFDSRQTINGTLSTTGTAGNRRVWFRGATYGLAQTLTINSAPSLTDADFRDIYVIGTAAPISGTRIGDLRGIRGITASTPKTVYWNLAAGGNWSANAWAATSGGGVSTDNFPLAQDTAVIENTGLNTSTSVVFDATSPYIGSIDMSSRTNAMTITNGTSAVSVYGNWTNGSGVTVSGSAAFTFSGRNAQTITSAGKSFTNPITIDSYGGTVELADALNIGSNSLTVTNGTFDTKNYNVTAGTLSSSNSNVRTITLGSSTVTLSAGGAITFSTSTNLTFNAGTSQINLTNNYPVILGGSGVAFYDLSATTSGSTHTLSIQGSNTFRNLSRTAPASAGYTALYLNNNQVITGTLTVSGATAVRRVFVFSSDTSNNAIVGTTRTLTVNSLSATDCDFRDITIAGTAAGSSPTRAGDCGGNTGITFPAPKTVYWNLAGAQNWSATAWAPGSGGTPNINNFPLAQDTAVFDNAGSVTGTISIDASWNIGTFDASNRTSAMTLSATGSNPFVYLDWKFGTGVTTSSTTGTIFFGKRGTQTITSNGVSFGCNITVDSATGTVQLADALTLGSARTLTLTSGTFDAVTYNVTTGTFRTDVTTFSRTLKMGSGTWTISGTGSLAWLIASSNFILYKGTANILFSDTSTTARSFNGAGLSYNKLTIGGATGTSTFTIAGDNQFTELASTKTVAHTIALGTTTQTFGAWTVTGTVGNVVTVTGTAALTIAGAAVSGVDYLALGTTTVSATSPGEFYAGANSTATGVAAPLYLTAKPADSTRYWVGGTGNWSDTARWSTSSGGGSGASVPRSHDDVVFDSLSNATAYTATVNAVTGGIRCKALTIAGPLTGNLTLAGSTAIVGIHGNVTLPATGLTRTYSGAITLSGSSTGRTLTTNGVTLASAITVNGVGCEWALGSALNNGTSNITVTNGNLLLSNYNLTAGAISSNNPNSRTINFGSGTISLSGSGQISFGTTETNAANLTVTASTSQINLSSVGGTFQGNGKTFYNVAFTDNNAFLQGIDGANTFNNLTVTGITSAGLKNVSFTANQTINGTLTLSAGTNATMRHFVRSDTIGTTRTLTCAAFSGTDADFRDITIAGAAAPVSGTRLGDCKGNSGITFPAAKTAYRFGTSTSYAGSNSWSLTAGGAGSNDNFPLAQDTVVFIVSPSVFPASGGTVTVDAAYNIGTIDMSARTSNTMTLATSTNAPAIYGNWINGTGTTLTGTGTLTFAGRGSQTITSAGKTFTQLFVFNSPSGSVTLQDAFVYSSASITLTAGTFDANIYNVTSSATGSGNGVNVTGALTRTMALGSGTWSIAGSGTAWQLSGSNATVTGTGTITMTSASAKTFAGGGISYSGITLDQGGAGALTITGNNTFANITNTYSATGATNITIGTTTQRVTQWTATGAATRVLTVQGTSASSPGTLILTGGNKPNVDYLAVTGVRAYSLVDTWYAGANSTNNGSLGWYFESGVVAITATISETSTATDAVSAVLTYISSLSETSTATDTVDAPGSTFNPSLSEAATATDAVAGTLTLLAQVADALTGTDTVSVTLTISPSVSETATATDEVSSKFSFAGIILESATITDAVSPKYNANPSVAETATATDSDSATAVFTPSLSETATATDAPSTANNTFNPSLAETATGTDSPVANLSVTGAVSETATATDTTQSVVIFVGAVSETATATDLISALTDFLGQIAETATATDITLVAPSVFGPQVQEAVAALDLVSTFATFNVQLVESATVLDSVIGAYLWNLIDDNQNPDWVVISTPQNPSWSVIDDSQNPNWQNTNNV